MASHWSGGLERSEKMQSSISPPLLTLACSLLDLKFLVYLLASEAALLGLRLRLLVAITISSMSSNESNESWSMLLAGRPDLRLLPLMFLLSSAESDALDLLLSSVSGGGRLSSISSASCRSSSHFDVNVNALESWKIRSTFTIRYIYLEINKDL